MSATQYRGVAALDQYFDGARHAELGILFVFLTGSRGLIQLEAARAFSCLGGMGSKIILEQVA
jgi:hypothetical protein